MERTCEGYKIIKEETYNKEEMYQVVIGHNPKSDMWVTWECTGYNNYYWGHYFTTYEKAIEDYHLRLAEKYGNGFGSRIC